MRRGPSIESPTTEGGRAPNQKHLKDTFAEPLTAELELFNPHSISATLLVRQSTDCNDGTHLHQELDLPVVSVCDITLP